MSGVREFHCAEEPQAGSHPNLTSLFAVFPGSMTATANPSIQRKSSRIHLQGKSTTWSMPDIFAKEGYEWLARRTMTPTEDDARQRYWCDTVICETNRRKLPAK
ncbi:hypothetical protein AJ79_07129 [Helicocarpus griseus UAMH5409]|uniref:Uncharacterized protein n=1 Tax=Helicocarpus griseus UAMH5409 TaxID=1447875 RepID=A0A2B7X6Q9_9EURO|nr:hypothetical protein AJ79_07129 [Helicocarpus griseus UAMH5409]